MSLTPAAINKMIQGLGSNADILSNLLTEKDNAGEAKSSISEYKIRLMFMERDLQQAEKKVAELEAENIRLLDKVEANEGTISDKLFAFCESNPNIVMTLLDKLEKMGFVKVPPVAP